MTKPTTIFDHLFSQPEKFNDVVACTNPACNEKQVHTFDPNAKRAQFFACTKCGTLNKYYPSKAAQNECV